MTTKLKPIPTFDSEAEERAFWESHDTTFAANKRDVPYQSLIKVWLAEKVRAE